MTKLRTNHKKGKSTAGGGMVVKVGVFAVILGGLFWLFNQFSGGETSMSEAIDKAEEVLKTGSDSKTDSDSGVLTLEPKIYPSSTTGQVIEHEYYALSYSEEHEQAEWVAYELTKESLQIPNVERTNNFRPDPFVRKASASDRDYRGAGYERGHLAPAGDMAFSEKAMSESFYMTNVSPQIKNFNGGIWRELEETVRDWAYKFGHIYVITGPVLTQDIRENIGDNEVSVPDVFYKIVLDYERDDPKAIAFIVPNEVSEKPIMDFAVTVDQVEELTGIDFFPKLITSAAAEKRLEGQFDKSLWRTNEKRYQLRREEWNKRK